MLHNRLAVEAHDLFRAVVNVVSTWYGVPVAKL